MDKIMRTNLIKFLAFAAFGLTAGCGPSATNGNIASNTANSGTNISVNTASSAKPAPNRAADNAELRAADMAWSEAAAKKDVDAVVGFMTDDGSTLPPNEPIQKGKEAIKKGWTALLGLKDLNISWTPVVVHVAESGDIGYTSGTWRMTFTDPKKGPLMDEGKYLEVWKKVDGKWKCEFDSYNSDLPTPAPAK